MTLKYNAILIPGGGIKKDGSLPEWTIRRLNKAVEIFSGSEYILTLSAGTVYKPPILNKEGFPIFESEAAADFLVKKGVDTKRILTEKISLDTIGNAYFARMIHVEPAKMEKLVVITSKFHILRTRVIFDWVFSLPPFPVEYRLDFIKVSDKDIDEQLVSARIEKERESLVQLRKTKKNIQNLSRFHNWLYSEHSAYATGLNPLKLSGKALNTY